MVIVWAQGALLLSGGTAMQCTAHQYCSFVVHVCVCVCVGVKCVYLCVCACVVCVHTCVHMLSNMLAQIYTQ